jgi:hypothetical protein
MSRGAGSGLNASHAKMMDRMDFSMPRRLMKLVIASTSATVAKAYF